jgi:hypothetical protein
MIEGDRPQPPSTTTKRIDNIHTEVSVAPRPISFEQLLKFVAI